MKIQTVCRLTRMFRVRFYSCMAGILLCLIAMAGTGCDISLDFLFPDMLVVSQTSYDFGLSNAPWVFQLWKKTAAKGTVYYSARSDQKWLICQPTTGSTTSPDDRREVLVSINPYVLQPGTNKATIKITSFFAKSKTITVTATGPESSATPTLTATHIKNTYSAPYQVDFTCSLMDDNAQPVVAEPVQFNTLCTEDGATVSPTETGARLLSYQARQMKCLLLMDYTASIMSLPNNDTNKNGVSDSVDRMEYYTSTALLPELPALAQVGVMEFHRERTAALAGGFTTNKDYVNGRIHAIRSEYVKTYPGSSYCWDAMITALNQFDNDAAHKQDESRYLILLSDGADESSTATPDDVRALADKLNVRIYVLAIGNAIQLQPLSIITENALNHIFIAQTNEAMTAACRHIIQQLQADYTIRWSSLKRADTPFTPGFLLSMTKDYFIYTAPDYNPAAYTGDPMQGTLRITSSIAGDQQQAVLRAMYLPRYIRVIRLYLHTPYAYTAAVVETAEGGLCDGWALTREITGNGSAWITLTSPQPDVIAGAIPFGAFGPILSFTMDKNDANPAPFDIATVDNSVYTDGQTLIIKAP